jgi:hypothetical protein
LRRLGTNWESSALVTALFGSVLLPWAWRDLRDHDGELVLIDNYDSFTYNPVHMLAAS